jgi:adenylyltransferase/sulfurtransferase
LGRPKAQSAKESLAEINPHVRVEAHDTRLTSANALRMVEDYDLVIDGTDNFQTRYLVNDVCVILGKPNVYGSVYRFEGQASVFAMPDGPCYRCIFAEPPPPGSVPSCAEAGVLGILPGLIGMIQATEACKLILGMGETLAGRLLLYDALAMRFQELRVRRDPACPVCGDAPSIRAPIDYEAFCGRSPGDAAPDPFAIEIEAAELWAKLRRGEPIAVIDVREPQEHAINRIPEASLIPLGQLAGRLDELDKDRETIVYCRSGARSARACMFLRRQGFGRVANLSGGILAWIEAIDPTLPRY